MVSRDPRVLGIMYQIEEEDESNFTSSRSLMDESTDIVKEVKIVDYGEHYRTSMVNKNRADIDGLEESEVASSNDNNNEDAELS